MLIVCHATVCRSPMAEYIVRRLLGDRPVGVTSAGTHPPGTLHRTFTLRQFGRLAAADPLAERVDAPLRAVVLADAPLRAVVRAAARARGRRQPAAPDADNLGDPIAGRPVDFRRCAEETERAMRPVVALIGAAG
ncbi:hypothetical protein ABZ807_15255 [Micromonospora sp. NPDC047548]|uniref:arsenate reductase/protein-tyrosine-phosphatase family protein n=1 Tax=Micromonospora sp. NPDC047548 TaxID=3155624 RepID=UPI0033CC8F88